MSHDPKLHTFMGFDEHSSKRMEEWLDKNYHIHRVRLNELNNSITLSNQLISEFFTWVHSLKEDLKLYLQYRYILHERSLVNKFWDFFVEDTDDVEKLNFFKKLFSLETELGVLMVATKKHIEHLLQDVPHDKVSLEEIHDILETITIPHYIDTSKSEKEIIIAVKTFVKYFPPFDYVDGRMKETCKHLRGHHNSLSKILDFHHQQLIILAQENGAIIVTDLEGNQYDVGASEIKNIKKIVEQYKRKYQHDLDSSEKAA